MNYSHSWHCARHIVDTDRASGRTSAAAGHSRELVRQGKQFGPQEDVTHVEAGITVSPRARVVTSERRIAADGLSAEGNGDRCFDIEGADLAARRARPAADGGGLAHVGPADAVARVERLRRLPAEGLTRVRCVRPAVSRRCAARASAVLAP